MAQATRPRCGGITGMELPRSSTTRRAHSPATAFCDLARYFPNVTSKSTSPEVLVLETDGVTVNV